VAALALGDKSQQVAINTELAARIVAKENESWLSTIKSRLVDTTKFANASSALGELRAYGCLLETWATVKPEPTVLGSEALPEFEVDAGDGPVIVEVHCRQFDDDQANVIGQHHDTVAVGHQAAVEKAPLGHREVTFAEIDVMPYGAPNPAKPNDSIVTNAISRIASTKEKEHQVDPDKPFVLWLDLQDPSVWGVPISEQQLVPLYTEGKDGKIGTGALWFALYGRKDDPMIESSGFSYQVRSMLHDGRFFQTMKSHCGPTRVSAVVYSLPEAIVLMENPHSQRPLPGRFRASLLKVPFFRLDRSFCEWDRGNVSTKVAAEMSTVRAAAKALAAFSP
jgi:hypothetical protein